MEPLLAAAAAHFDLGRPVAWREVPEGFVNRVLRLDTDRGAWAVKVLDRSASGLADAERLGRAIGIELAAMDAGLPLPRVVRDADGRVVARIGVEWVRVHDWAHGWSPDSSAAAPDLAHGVGELLHALHAARLPYGDGEARRPVPVPATAPFRAHLEAAQRRGRPWAGELEATMACIEALAGSLAATVDRPGPLVGTHCDLYPRNVLVGERGLVACDWDAAGPWTPAEEVAAAAVEWSGGILGSVDPRSFAAVVQGYGDRGGPVPPPEAASFAGFFAKQLDWLEGQLRQALGKGTNAAIAERRLGFLLPRLRRQHAERDEWVELLGIRARTSRVVPLR